jgi:sugar lactone lactonase YvrE
MRWMLLLFAIVLLACGEPENFDSHATPGSRGSPAAMGPTVGLAMDATAIPDASPWAYDPQVAADMTATAVEELRPPSYYWPPMPTAGLPGNELSRTFAPASLASVLESWGTWGQEPGALDGPHGIAIDSLGRVLVADAGNSRVQIFDTSGVYLAELGGGAGDEPGQFRGPTDVCVAPDGSVFVVDSSLGRVQQFTADGSYVLGWGLPELQPDGTQVVGERQLFHPWSLACSLPDEVLVADSGTWRIVRYSADGVYRTSWRVNDEFTVGIAPVVAVALLPDGRLLAGDLSNARVVVYDLDGRELGTLIDVDRAGTPAFIPWSIEIDSVGSIYINDIRNQRLLKLNPSGELSGELYLADIAHDDFYLLNLVVATDGTLYFTESNAPYPSGDPALMFAPAQPGRVDRVVVCRPPE